jgi:ATP-dependent helicase/nuclease subunit A
MSKKWTKSQEMAIKAKGGWIIVSAAAGSGKTECLSERIISLVLNTSRPCDITRLLVVTFTKAAAEQMRQRIKSKLCHLILKHPANNYLRYQQMLLCHANIGTVHSFCNKLVRENFNSLSISRNFRIADASEILTLEDEAIKKILEEFYKECSAEFIALVENINSQYDDSKLVELIKNVYKFSRSLPSPVNWFEEIKRKLSVKDVKNNNYIEIILEYATESINFLLELCRSFLEDKDVEAYFKVLNADLQIFLNLKNVILNKNWDFIKREIDEICFLRLPSIKMCEKEKQKISEYRKKVKETTKNLTRLFCKSWQHIEDDIDKTYNLICPLFELVKKLEAELWKIKKQRNLLDFSDLEHLTLKLLVKEIKHNKEIVKTDLATEISRDFDEILVDEYQDTNEIQDMIFRSISKNEKNLFLVGDIKQSIYSFRQARPEIFVRKKKLAKTYDEANATFPAKISLGENFRSHREIIDFINFVFMDLMTLKTSPIDYKKDEIMRFPESNTCEQKVDQKESSVTICVVESEYSTEKQRIKIEADYIAKSIKDMVESRYMIKDGTKIRPAQYKDFCILLRNTKNSCEIFKKALQTASIEVHSENTDNFLDLPEILMILSFLRCINNPTDDISLTATVMSPIFGFTADQIALIRQKNRETNMYTCIKKSSENDANCARFLKELSRLRRISQEIGISRLISYIYSNFFVFSFVKMESGGKDKIKNLRSLISFARKIEESGRDDLSNFLKFIDKIIKDDITLSDFRPVSTDKNCVKITSIHKAKGLEFPVCIVANCSCSFHIENNDTLLHPQLGVGLKIFDVETMCKYRTVQREAILIKNKGSQISEELRILYVAMTRAKNKLIFSLSTKNLEKDFSKLLLYKASDGIKSHLIKNASNFGDWLSFVSVKHPYNNPFKEMSDHGKLNFLNESCSLEVKIIKQEDFCTNLDDKECQKLDDTTVKKGKSNLYSNGKNKNFYDEKITTQKESFIENEPDLCQDKRFYDEKITARKEFHNANKIRLKLLKRFTFEQKEQKIIHVPTKVSVTELCDNFHEDLPRLNIKPKFLAYQKFSSLEIGSAQHKFLQLANFKKARENIRSHILELLKSKFLTVKESENLNIKKLESFLNSKICSRILNSKNFLREYHFIVDIAAEKINPNLTEKYKGQMVVLQGAVDAAFEENGKMVIVDYKTDKTKSPSELAAKYKKQLGLYGYAISKCTEKPIGEIIIYSIELEKSLVLWKNWSETAVKI